MLKQRLGTEKWALPSHYVKCTDGSTIDSSNAKGHQDSPHREVVCMGGRKEGRRERSRSRPQYRFGDSGVQAKEGSVHGEYPSADESL